METSQGKTRSLACPHCAEEHVVSSKSRKRFDRIMRLLGRTPMRCLMCRHRFFVRPK